MIRSWIVCVVFALAFAGAEARAQTPSEESLAVAREVVSLTGGAESMRAMIDSMRPTMLQDLRSRGVPEDFAQRYITVFMEEFEAEIPRILELSAIAYAGAFTVEQLREIRTFYSSETGRAVAAQTPELTAAMSRAGVMIAEEITPRVVARVQGQAAPSDPS